MADKKNEQSSFTVTDRRLFTSDGELRKDVPEESETPKAAPQNSEIGRASCRERVLVAV